jgi:sec-independent protein translocase protein TatA
MAYGLSGYELWIVAGLVVLLFGGAKMATLGKGLGEGIREFKKSMSGDEDDKKGGDGGTPVATTDTTSGTTQTAK